MQKIIRALTAVALLTLPACSGSGETPGAPTDSAAPTSPTQAPATTAAAVATLPPVPQLVSAQEDDPVVRPAEGERYVNPGWTVSEDGVLWMFRNSFSAFPGPSRTDLMRSDDDGRTWMEVGPVFTSDEIEATGNNAFLMTGWIDDAGWHGVVATYDGPGSASVFVRVDAPGPEGPWEIQPTPLLEPGASGGFDDLRIREPSLVTAPDGTMHLYYTGWSSLTGPGQIGLATSTDGGATWVGQGMVLAGSQAWDGGGVGGAQALRDEHGWVLVYDTNQSRAKGVGVATSDDGVSWTPWPGNPILDPGRAPGGRRFFQSEVLEAAGTILYLLEVGGTPGTEVHLLSLDLEALGAATAPPELVVDVVSADTEVELSVVVDGVELGGGAGYHPHVFVDRDVLPVGTDLPESPNIVHGTGSTLTVENLSSGSHVLWVALGDGDDLLVVPPQPVLVEVDVP